MLEPGECLPEGARLVGGVGDDDAVGVIGGLVEPVGDGDDAAEQGGVRGGGGRGDEVLDGAPRRRCRGGRVLTNKTEDQDAARVAAAVEEGERAGPAEARREGRGDRRLRRSKPRPRRCVRRWRVLWTLDERFHTESYSDFSAK